VLVTGLLATTLAWLGWVWWRTDRLTQRHPVRWLVIATATMIVCWLPPVIEQLHPGTGNMRKLYHQFTDPGEPFVGARAAIKAMIGRFNLFGPWLIDPLKDPRSSPNYLGFVLFAVLVGASVWWAWKRHERVELTLFAVLSVATVLGFMSTTRIFGTFFDYVIRWMSPLVAMWIAACMWSCWLTWRARPSSASNNHSMVTGMVLGVALMTVVTVVGVARATSAEIPYKRDSTLTGELSAQLERSLDPTVHYQINEFDPVALGSAAFGLALELERHHLHAGVGPWGRAGVMPFRVVSDEQAESTLWYVASKPTIAAFAALPGAAVRASFDVRSADEAKRSDQLAASLLQMLCAAGRPDLRGLLYSRWGDTALAYTPGLPSGRAPLLQEYTDLRQPAAVVELPVGINGYDVAPQPPACAG
jgi:hypothetical protein